MNNIEIELRYEILDLNQLSKFLVSMNYIHKKHDIDIYLDTPQAILYQKGIFIRIRNNKKLDIKFNRACLDDPCLEIQDYCEEHSFSLPLQEIDLNKLNNILESLNLITIPAPNLDLFKLANNLDIHYIIDKKRTSYIHNQFTLSIDEVFNLGSFLEIELMAQNIENLAYIKQDMEKLLSNLSLKPLKTGYGTLLLRKNNFEHYLKGRFILKEDRAT